MHTKPCLGDEKDQLTVTLSLDPSEDLTTVIQALPVVIQARAIRCRQFISAAKVCEDYPHGSLLYLPNVLTDARRRSDTPT